MTTQSGSAAEFVLNLFHTEPERAWRIADLRTASAERWTTENLHNTLTRLEVRGLAAKATSPNRVVHWSANHDKADVAKAPEPARIASPTVHAAGGKQAGAGAEPTTASEFVLHLLDNDPELEWKTAEIVEAGQNRWNEPNVHKSLVRLHRAGKIGKTVNGRSTWWSSALAKTGAAKAAKAEQSGDQAAKRSTTSATRAEKAVKVAPKAEKPAKKAATPTTSAPTTEAEKRSGNAYNAILDLLTRFPQYELQVADIFEELGGKWARPTLSNNLEALVQAGKVTRLKEDRKVWYSVK